MSNNANLMQNTDSINVENTVTENQVVSNTETEPVLGNEETPSESNEKTQDTVYEDPENQDLSNTVTENQDQTSVSQRPSYEVVFFVKYKNSPRPSEEDICNYFNTYGSVHHVVCPTDRNFAFVFMTQLATDIEHRRTRTIISQIITEMDPNNRFHITVASSRRPRNRTNYQQRGRGFRNRWPRRIYQERKYYSNNQQGQSDDNNVGNNNLIPVYENTNTNRYRGGNRGRGRGRGSGRIFNQRRNRRYLQSPPTNASSDNQHIGQYLQSPPLSESYDD